MIVLTSDRLEMGPSELPGPGKRTMPPPSPLKKQTKNLNQNSKNHLLPLWGTTATEDLWDTAATEDPWDLVLSEEEPVQQQQEPELEISEGLEAFANRIGLRLDNEWTDLNVNNSTESDSAPPMFHDYALPPKDPMEEVWGCLVSPADVEGRQMLPTVVQEQIETYDINENDQPKVIIPEATLTESDYEELEAFLQSGLPNNTMMEVESAEPLIVPDGESFDLVQFAMGQSGLIEAKADEIDTGSKKIKLDPEVVQMEPVNNVDIEIIQEHDIKLEPAGEPLMEPNTQANTASIQERKRKKPGRPTNKEPINVTQIPRDESRLSEQELKALKYRRTRDLNNKASRRFRQRKKEEDDLAQQELLQLEARNLELRRTLAQMEKDMALMRAQIPNFPVM